MYSPTKNLTTSPIVFRDLGEGAGVATGPEPFVFESFGLEEENLAPFLFFEDQRLESRIEAVKWGSGWV